MARRANGARVRGYRAGTWRGADGRGESIAYARTFNWSFGAEIGIRRASPFRLACVRPASVRVGKARPEGRISAGLGRQFSGGRGRLDIGLERLQRRGTGLNERVWTFSGADRAAVKSTSTRLGVRPTVDTERVRQAFDASGATVVDDPSTR